MDFWKHPDKKKRAAIKFLLQAQVVSSGVEYRLSNSDEIRSGDGGGIQNGCCSMGNNSRNNTGNNIGIEQCDIQARGSALLRWLRDSCRDGRLSFLQIQYQLIQRSLIYGLYCNALDPGIRLFLQ